MSAVAHPAEHHPAPHRPYSRLFIDRLGFWLFLASESLLFAGLLVSRFYLRGTYRPAELNQIVGLIITSILLVSSLTAYRAETAIGRGDQPTFLRSVLATILLGVVFVAGVAYEWSQALVHFPPRSGFGTVFFSMTGLHALHVVSGILLLSILYWNGRRGKYSAESHWAAEAIVKYWHFVDVVWVFFYPALYLV